MWQLEFTSKAQKQIARLPRLVRAALDALVTDIIHYGPVRGNWPNYGKLENKRHHCHIKKGHPTYVVVWQEINGRIQLVRIIYAGTHEDAPY